jgi:hypothetical protein
MSLGTGTLLLLASSLLSSAADNQFAGTWKLNAAESKGTVPACVQNGVLHIRPGIYKGDSSDRKTAPAKNEAQSGKCASVYLFSPSADGRTLTVTQPQDPSLRAVFEKVD